MFEFEGSEKIELIEKNQLKILLKLYEEKDDKDAFRVRESIKKTARVWDVEHRKRKKNMKKFRVMPLILLWQ